MISKYGFFDGSKYSEFVNATDLRGACVIMVKSLMKKNENNLK